VRIQIKILSKILNKNLINPLLWKVKLTNLLRKRNKMKIWALLIKNNKIVLNSKI
jgi:hypothetical protein